jgi:hypothetical protein
MLKFSKKVTAVVSAAALLASAFVFTSCTEEDDPYNMITEKNSTTWTIAHTNSDADTIHRGYKSTNFAHAGGLVNIHFDEYHSTAPDGVMGIIFGLHSNATNSKANDFFVVGVRNNGDYYVSAYTNVTNLQGDNFGVADNDGAEETEYVSLKTSVPTGKGSTANGYDLGIYFRDVVDDAEADASTGTYTHHYEVYFVNIDTSKEYDVDDDTGDLYVGGKAKAAGSTIVDLGTLIKAIPYESTSGTPSEYKFAPYANVYPMTGKCSTAYIKAGKATGTGTVTGTWTIPADYKHADLVED